MGHSPAALSSPEQVEKEQLVCCRVTGFPGRQARKPVGTEGVEDTTGPRIHCELCGQEGKAGRDGSRGKGQETMAGRSPKSPHAGISTGEKVRGLEAMVKEG